MTLHPQSVAVLAALEADPSPPVSADGVDIGELRRAMASQALSEPRSDLPYVRDVDADGVRCRIYRPRAGAPVLLYAHGGGWVLGDLDTHDRFVRHLALRTGWAVMSVDYRLAPEHPYPAPLDDVERALHWLRRNAASHDIDASVVAGVGDSSGGNLIAGLSIREPGAFAMQALVYPPLDPAGSHPSFESEDIAILSTAEMRWFWDVYLPDERFRRTPEAAPEYAVDLSRMPETYLVTAEHDVLRDEGEAFAARLANAGVRVVGQRVLGMTHGFWRRPWDFDAAADSVEHLAVALNRHLSLSVVA